MKSLFLRLALLLGIVSPCFAGGIVEVPTVTAGISQLNMTAVGGAAQMNYYGVGVDTPLSKTSQLGVSIALGTNYGVSSTQYTINYKFEIGGNNSEAYDGYAKEPLLKEKKR